MVTTITLACTFVFVSSPPSWCPAAAAYPPRQYRYSNDNDAARSARPDGVGSSMVYRPLFTTVAAPVPFLSNENHSGQTMKRPFNQDTSKFSRWDVLRGIPILAEVDVVDADVSTPQQRTT